MKLTIWHGCYDKSLNGFIAPAAFSHPAKFSLGLIERIYDHLLERGWLKRGDCVGDPFGGVAIGGLVAAYRKLEWYGVELESKFVALAEQNIALHQSRLNALGAPWPRIIRGDSRKFHVLIGESDAVVSSPPYADTQTTAGNVGNATNAKGGSVDACISSPPYLTSTKGGGGILDTGYTSPDGKVDHGIKSRHSLGSGNDRSDGNIETLKEGSVEGVVSSPPYAGNGQSSGTESHPERCEGSGKSISLRDGYGESNGQIDNLKTGDVEAVVTSPPYAEGLGHGGGSAQYKLYKEKGILSQATEQYGESAGQIGQEKAESYWQAMDLVYRSCFQAIKPGGVIAIVVKDYCKSGKRVRLCDDTLKLLCHIGFTPLDRIHAMLVSETVEAGLFGEERTKRQRKSFFRRLHEDLIQAQIHWVNVERKPFLLRRAKSELWSDYRDRVDSATEKEKSDPSLWPPPKPTASKVLREAQFFAWREAGKPLRADERRIDHEEVLICRKP